MAGSRRPFSSLDWDQILILQKDLLAGWLGEGKTGKYRKNLLTDAVRKVMEPRFVERALVLGKNALNLPGVDLAAEKQLNTCATF